MLRSLVFALAAVAASTLAPARADTPAAEAEVRFPLPKDATSQPDYRKGGGGRIATYDVPRGKVAVTDEVRAALKEGKWEILKDEPSPSGNATRIQAKKGGKVWKVSFTGDKDRTTIIVTLP